MYGVGGCSLAEAINQEMGERSRIMRRQDLLFRARGWVRHGERAWRFKGRSRSRGATVVSSRTAVAAEFAMTLRANRRFCQQRSKSVEQNKAAGLDLVATRRLATKTRWVCRADALVARSFCDESRER
jgi:hypothetical protein